MPSKNFEFFNDTLTIAFYPAGFFEEYRLYRTHKQIEIFFSEECGITNPNPFPVMSYTTGYAVPEECLYYSIPISRSQEDFVKIKLKYG